MADEKEQDGFENETRILTEAQSVYNDSNVSDAEFREAFKALMDGYSNLLEETKFLTKQSDRLQHKLNAAREKLEIANKSLEQEATEAKTVAAKTQKQNKKLTKVSEEAYARVVRTQTYLLITMGVMFVIILIGVYYFFLKDSM